MDDEIGFVKWVAQGKEQEPYAVKQFEFVNEVELEPGGFITTNDGRIGASPDRMFKGHKESLEIKSPAPWTQLKYLLEGPDDAYVAQTQGHLLVGDELDAVHFYSYNPRTPPFHKVILRDNRYQAVLASALNSFCDILDQQTERARALGAFAVVRQSRRPPTSPIRPMSTCSSSLLIRRTIWETRQHEDRYIATKRHDPGFLYPYLVVVDSRRPAFL